MAGDNLCEHRMEVVSARGVHLINFFEVHPFKEFKVNRLDFLALCYVENLIRGHAFTALFRGGLQAGNHFASVSCFVY